jgi:hypothetical protein
MGVPPLVPLTTTNVVDNATVRRLAALPFLEYEKVRESEAKALKIRKSVLDRLVEAERPPSSFSNGQLQGRGLELPEVEPWPLQVNGAELLSQIADTFNHYIALPDGAADALALWCAHAHVFEAFPCTPRLNVTSPEKGCGKTTLRDVISCFVPRALLAENMSVAVLFRVIEKAKPTILADECDGWIKENPELINLLNSGHRRGGQAWRCEGDNNEVRGFNVFAPIALCGIRSLPGTLYDRSIIIRLERARPDELRARFDSRHVEKETELCRKLARF